MDSFDLDAIWEDAQTQFDIMKEESKEPVKITNECNHAIKTLDTVTSDIVCSTCGAVVGRDSGQSVEWSNYKDESGNYSRNTQRADLIVDDNPYFKGGTICGMFKNNKSLAAKIHLQQCFSHKQRTYWQISQVFENICTKAGLKADVLATAKHMWYICMESGKLTRASVREGLIASCLYYSCVFNKTPTNRNDILKYFDFRLNMIF